MTKIDRKHLGEKNELKPMMANKTWYMHVVQLKLARQEIQQRQNIFNEKFVWLTNLGKYVAGHHLLYKKVRESTINLQLLVIFHPLIKMN